MKFDVEAAMARYKDAEVDEWCESLSYNPQTLRRRQIISLARNFMAAEWMDQTIPLHPMLPQHCMKKMKLRQLTLNFLQMHWCLSSVLFLPIFSQ